LCLQNLGLWGEAGKGHIPAQDTRGTDMHVQSVLIRLHCVGAVSMQVFGCDVVASLCRTMLTEAVTTGIGKSVSCSPVATAVLLLPAVLALLG
jgi:hypothetical protein